MNETPEILVVDDDPRIIQLLQQFLDISGFAVRTAMDADDARNALEESLPDLMILDVMLPSVDGIEFCASVRSQDGWDKFPIIMFSAKSDSQDVQRALDAGATEYISKPAPLKTMLSMIRKLLDMPQEPLQELLPDDQLSTE